MHMYLFEIPIDSNLTIIYLKCTYDKFCKYIFWLILLQETNIY